MERVARLELASTAWKAMALPLDDTRKLVLHNRIERFFLPYQDSALADELVEETGAE